MFQIKFIEDQAQQLITDANCYEFTVTNELVSFAQRLDRDKYNLENVRSEAFEVCNSEIDTMVKQYTKTVNSIKAATSAKIPTYSPMYRQLQIGKNEFMYCESVACNLPTLCKFKLTILIRKEISNYIYYNNKFKMNNIFPEKMLLQQKVITAEAYFYENN